MNFSKTGYYVTLMVMCLAIFLTLVASFNTAHAQTVSGVRNGGTGWGLPGGILSGSILFGNGLTRLGTSSALQWNNTGSILTATNASTTNFSALTKASFGSTATSSFSSAGVLTLAGLATGCLTNTNGVVTSTNLACGSGGSTVSDFTFPTNFGAIVAATSSKVWLQNTLYASSSIQFNTNLISEHPSLRFLDIQGRANGDYTLARIKAPTNPSGPSKEATLSLLIDVVGDNSGVSEEFIDFYNEHYSDSQQWGLRQAYSGIGVPKPAVFGYWNTAGQKDAGNLFGFLPNGTVFASTATSTVDQGSRFYISSSTAAALLTIDATPGTERFTVLSGGNVGISSSTPWATFAVNPIAGQAANTFVVGSSTATQFVIKNGGNVGVGTTTPWAQLSINPNGIAGPSFAIGSSTATNFIVTNGGNVGIGSATMGASDIFNVGTSSSLISVNKISGKTGFGCANTSSVMYTFGCGSNANVNASTQLLLQDASDARLGVSVADHGVFMSSGDASTYAGLFAFNYIGGVAMNLALNQFGGNVGIGTTTPGTMLSLGNTGASTINLSPTATSTFGSGLNIRTGCYAINGTCLSTGGGGTPAGSQNYIQYNNAGAFAGSNDFQWDNTNKILSIATSSALTSQIITGSNTGIYSGGYLDLYAGGDGQSIFTRTADALSSDAGKLRFHGGMGSTTGSGGGMTFTLGNGSTDVNGSGNGGSFFLSTGNGGALGGGGGSAGITAGDALGGASNGGSFSLQAGHALGGTGNGGGFEITAGSSFVGNGNGGNINLLPGAGFGSGLTGTIGFIDPVSINKYIFNTSPATANRTLKLPDIDGTFVIASTTLSNGFVGFASSTPWAQVSINPTALNGSAPSFVVGSSSATKFIVSSTGFVGVGTTSPSDVFTVSVANNAGIRVSSTNSGFLETGNGSAGRWRMQNDFTQGGQLEFLYNNNTGSAPGTTALTLVGNGAAAGSRAGNVGVGTTTPWARFSIDATSVGTAALLAVGSSTATYFKIDNGGKVYAPNTTSASSAQTGYWCYDGSGQFIRDTAVCLVSALKFKKDIYDLTPRYGLAAVMQMRPITYFLKKPFGVDDARQQIGFVADWSEKVVPQLVTHDANGDVHGFNYEQYTAVLTKAIQEQQHEIENLKIGVVTISRSAEENWQWMVIALLFMWNIALTLRKR